MGQAIRSRNLRKSGFSVVNGVWSKTGAVEGETILGEAQDDLEPVAKAAAVSEAAAAAVDPEIVPIIPSVSKEVPAAAVPAVAEEASSIRIEDIPPEHIEPFGQFSEVPLPSSQVGSLLRDALDSISQGEPVAHETNIAKSVAEVHTEDVVMEEAPSQQEQVQIQEDDVMKSSQFNKKKLKLRRAVRLRGREMKISQRTSSEKVRLPVPQILRMTKISSLQWTRPRRKGKQQKFQMSLS
ncbi:hypothetical protein Taro_009085 [Colocasia esculenta]|uniref:Uncharacterized protein n=1 Tax=Colocasia esculenta TaxID=4460 RepID=A0A843U421_COLES|nr:hypothetical protein [Colocasia esculenta]